MKVAVVGATGMVGQMMLKVLEERAFPVSELIPVASSHSVGKEVTFRGESHKVVSMEEGVAAHPDIALFSAGGSVSKEWAPAFASTGCVVIDNSSAWRMEKNIPLVVPEVNSDILTSEDKIIANPNCSTIQLVVALHPIHQQFGIRRIIVSTYQAVSGTGMKAVQQYYEEARGEEEVHRVYHYPIYANVIPHCDVFLDNDYTKEEMKLVHETRKIMRVPDMPVTATAVRVPVIAGHSESINIELSKDTDAHTIRNILEQAPGIKVYDDPADHKYPMPGLADGRDAVWVGRIRKDESSDRCWNLFVVADNLRKGAATNAVQIAELLIEKGILKAEKQSDIAVSEQ